MFEIQKGNVNQSVNETQGKIVNQMIYEIQSNLVNYLIRKQIETNSKNNSKMVRKRDDSHVKPLLLLSLRPSRENGNGLVAFS